MTICSQCLGGKVTVGQEAIIDQSSNTQTFQPGGRGGAVPCSQCAGVGYY